MVVRKYCRRNRDVAGTCSGTAAISASEHVFDGPLSQDSPHDVCNLGFSSQDSSPWFFDPEEPFGSSQVSLPVGGDQKAKRERSGKQNSKPVFGKRRRMPPPPSPATTAMATLMETQESGEIMEHVDEVNFALDGLREGQPVRIRRASLLSLLSICATAEQRRLLRNQGMAKTIIDSIQCLSMDDSPSTLAAAALFYILTSDGQDNLLLESPSSITFLVKLLKPVRADTNNGKAPSISSKLLALCKEVNTLKDTTKRLDSGSAEIVCKVEEILVKCKELKSSVGCGGGMGRPELSPKWIALLTMEKASSPTISLEDTFRTMTKTDGNFKEKLREYGGLDAIFDVALDCHSVLEGKFRRCSLNQNMKDNAYAQSLVLFLKFLKVMENSTFLNKDNQIHLLEMRKKLEHQKSLSFTELVISMIKTLSGLFLDKNHAAYKEDKSYKCSNGISCSSDMALVLDPRALGGETSSKWSNMTSPEKCSSLHQNSLSFSTLHLGSSGSISHASDSCTVTSGSSNRERQVTENGSSDKFALGKHSIASEEIGILENSEDPFAFDDEDFGPSNWDFLSGKQKVSRTQKNMVVHKEPENGFKSSLTMSQHEPSNDPCHHTFEMSCSAIADDEISDLLANCLVAAVKVLMNLTNDNPIGCQQIATYGGLETMSTLIPSHFPLFSSSPSPSVLSETLESDSLSQSTIDPDNQNHRHLTEQQLDFLVAILGLLVNLVEKDGHNRSRLAAAVVLLPSSQRLNEEIHKDVISLLCSIFLANQGAGEAADEGSLVSENDEAALLLGEKEAEKTIIEAYSALLLAFLCSESKSIRDSIAERLPEHNLAILVPVLERFLAFHLTLNMISPETHTAVSEVIESCKVP